MDEWVEELRKKLHKAIDSQDEGIPPADKTGAR